MQVMVCDNMDAHCSGGLPFSAMEWLIKEGHADTEDSYPYSPKWNALTTKCLDTKATVGAKISACSILSCGQPDYCDEKWVKAGCPKSGGAFSPNNPACLKNETELRTFIAKNGPISIGIDASFMKDYKSGVACPTCDFLHPPSGGSFGPHMDHGVTIVGWGSDPKVNGTAKDYWLIKNSWNQSWGENGYYRICRGIVDKKTQCDPLSKEPQCYETCGVNGQVSSAVV
jgi:cathepsin F